MHLIRRQTRRKFHFNITSIFLSFRFVFKRAYKRQKFNSLANGEEITRKSKRKKKGKVLLETVTDFIAAIYQIWLGGFQRTVRHGDRIGKKPP